MGFNEISALAALAVLTLCAAMFALGWLLDRRRKADGLFAAQALCAALAFPCASLGFYAPLGGLATSAILLTSMVTAVGAVQFTCVHLARPEPPTAVWLLAAGAVLVVVVTALLGLDHRVAVVALVAVNWACLAYAITILGRQFRAGGQRAEVWTLLAAWSAVAAGGTPWTLRHLGLHNPTGGLDPLPLAAGVFAALHAFVLVAERARALRANEAATAGLARQLATVERQHHELRALDEELRRQLLKRAEELEAGAARMLSGLRPGAHAPPKVGATLDGRYLLEDVLGRGGMGVVFGARRPDGVRVAVKVLRRGPTPDAVVRFAREGRLVAQLRHPNVVTLLDVGLTDEGLSFLVLEHVEGPNLATLIARGLAPAEARRHATAISAGLAAIHAHGIVHRDLKPANVLVGPDGVAKIADFGIGALLGPALVDPSSPTLAATPAVALTGTHDVVGTPAYMPPEQALGEAPAPSGDVFALGMVLCELFTGRLPFATPPMFAPTVMDPTQVEALARAAGAALAQTIAACLALAPGDRPTAAAVAEALTRERA